MKAIIAPGRLFCIFFISFHWEKMYSILLAKFNMYYVNQYLYFSLLSLCWIWLCNLIWSTFITLIPYFTLIKPFRLYRCIFFDSFSSKKMQNTIITVWKWEERGLHNFRHIILLTSDVCPSPSMYMKLAPSHCKHARIALSHCKNLWRYKDVFGTLC